MRSLRLELAQGARILRSEPALSFAAIVTIGLAVGATTALFSVLYGVLLRPLPYRGADRLVQLWEEHPGGTPAVPHRLNALTFKAWSSQPRTLEGLGAYAEGEHTVAGPGEPERIAGARVSASTFPLLGVTAEIGRLFHDEDAVPGAAPVVVLSHAMWQQQFGGRPEAVGTAIRVDGRPHEIIGVMPAWFYFPGREARLWTPFANAAGADPRTTSVMSVVGRVRADATLAQVEAEGTASARQDPRPMSAELTFGKGAAPVVDARPFLDVVTARVRPPLLLAACAVCLVLVLACVNVANLLLARGLTRARELAIRTALGASRPQIVRHLLAESAVLALAGGAVGLGLAWALVRALPAWAPRDFPRLDDVRIDETVLAFSLMVTCGAALLAGLLPAVRSSRATLDTLLGGGGGRTVARGPDRLRSLLLGIEAALGVVLLVGAALLGRSFVALATVDAGYNPRQLLAARIHVPPERRDTAGSVIATLLQRLEAVPGVEAAGAGNMAPFGDSTYLVGFQVAPATPMVRALYSVVTPGYAPALGLELRAGRFLVPADATSALQALVVNEAFVRAYLRDDRPVVGRRFQGFLSDEDTTSEIVGVVGDVLLEGMDAVAQPQIYVSLGGPRQIRREIYLFARTTGSPDQVLPELRRIVHESGQGVALSDAGPFTRQVEASIAQPRFSAAVFGTISVLALVLAASGLYAAVSYSVSRRRREMGIRAALGAERADIVRLVLRHGLGVTAAGCGVGLAGATISARALQPLLFGVSPLDPVSLTVAPLLLMGVAAAACAVPARRASRVDPAEALHVD